MGKRWRYTLDRSPAYPKARYHNINTLPPFRLGKDTLARVGPNPDCFQSSSAFRPSSDLAGNVKGVQRSRTWMFTHVTSEYFVKLFGFTIATDRSQISVKSSSTLLKEADLVGWNLLQALASDHVLTNLRWTFLWHQEKTGRTYKAAEWQEAIDANHCTTAWHESTEAAKQDKK